MTKFTVKYTLHRHVYQSEVYTDSSGSAMYWVMNLFPEATNIAIVNPE
jgi:hypothetical protein